MAKQRVINTRFWIDGYVSGLKPEEKLLFLYLLTNPSTEICGIYEIPIKNMSLDTGIDVMRVNKILKKFSKDGKVHYIDGWICIINFVKHQAINPSIKIGIKRGLDIVPTHIRDRLGTGWVQAVGYLNLNLNLNTITSSPKDVRVKTMYKETIINEDGEIIDSPLLEEKQRKGLTEGFKRLSGEYARLYGSIVGGRPEPYNVPTARSRFNAMIEMGYTVDQLIKYLPGYLEDDFYGKNNWLLRSFLSEGTLAKLKKEYD